MDIVEQLRKDEPTWAMDMGQANALVLCHKAANEIERLREALQKVDACLEDKEQFWATRIEDAQNIIFDALHGKGL